MILVVADQDDLRFLLIEALLRLGKFRIIHASDGAEGLEMGERHRPDCEITDIMMPNLDGFQFMQAVRGDPLMADTPIIVLTAMAQEQNQFKGMTIGADRYFLHSARPQEIIAVVLISTNEHVMRMQRLAQE